MTALVAAPDLLPASGAWTPARGIGRRRFADLGPQHLDSGEHLPAVCLAYETWGRPTPSGDNAILVLHALTGDSHVAGEATAEHPTPGWWEHLVGPGRPLDTDRWFIVAPNVLGGCQGSTGPSSDAPDGRPWGSRFPRLTVRDQVRAEQALQSRLGIRRWALVIGGSMGGMRALEWAITAPQQVERLAVIASGAAATADQIAWNSAQLAAIRTDPGFLDGDYYARPDGQGPHRGLGLARRIAHTTYRTAAELESRFGHAAQDPTDDPLRGGRHQVTSYLDHHAHKLAARFDANSYVRLVEAMSTHDVGRDRGGADRALARISARTLAVGIDTDRLFPAAGMQRIARAIPGALYREVHAPCGHDAFLLPGTGIEQWVTDLLRQ
ncbi:homoserine O-acetyltransferase [Brachybacterium sp. EF45031]|uniref:homoserine O-acetyltransferase MetX n=1 Tax=Brachybacterium sillae TaxID=2810536 RepID=UPI00217DD626|nr:homoserine O-acetyltransferase [Brachybacterium sillae]MCS6710498.1 homoserine O-acetyltransferase [Brachybacterium sillae]